MSAYELITGISWAVFLGLFATTAIVALRRPSRSHIDIALLFAAPAAIVAAALAASAGLFADTTIYGPLIGLLQLALPFMTLRLARDFATVRAWVVQLALLIFLALGVAGFLLHTNDRWWLFPSQLAYFFSVQLYSAVAFAAEARRARGITARRLGCVSVGALLLGVGPFAVVIGQGSELWMTLYALFNLGAGLCYFLGFAPPVGLRRSWQEPELRAFLRSATGLVNQADEALALRALEQGVAAALGAPYARIGLWEESRAALRFELEGEDALLPAGASELARRAFVEQRALHSSGYAQLQVALVAGASPLGATLAAPLSTGTRRMGVLLVYTPREALFARDDLEVLELLAVHAAGVLESRALTIDLARVQARAETARLKQDFLSAAAHDLKTPLTALLAQAQLMQRRLERRPEEPPDPRLVAMVVQSAERLRDLVTTMLDAARAEQGQLLGARAPLDLAALAVEVAGPYDSGLHPCRVRTEGPALVNGDRIRLAQLLGHLLDNAVKYSPAGGLVEVWVRCVDEEVLLSVSDRGIGISAADLPHLFKGFYRGANVDDRSFSGMGLSLALCRAIAEQHGGRIWVESQLGIGSRFTVALPLVLEGAG